MGDVPEQVRVAAMALCISEQDAYHDDNRPDAPCAKCIEATQVVIEVCRAGQAALGGEEPRRNPHVAEYMSGRMSPRCLNGMDGCDDLACICRCHEPAAVAPDAPREWALPDEPGPEVTAIRDARGRRWDRDAIGWTYQNYAFPWVQLLRDLGPLTDASEVSNADQS
jgi:hypothetical protein